MRAAAYVRISNDPEGRRAGVERQRSDALRLVDDRGWQLVGVYEDNDVSASNGARRPGYEALLEAVGSGEVDRVVCWATSRLWRRRTERAEAIELLKDAGVSVETVKGPSLDLSTFQGRGFAAMMGEFDTMESEAISERVVAWHSQRAASGAPPNAGTRPFGYDRHRQDVGPLVWVEHPDEAPVVRELFKRVLAGESVTALRNDLNARGVSTSTGKGWTSTTLTRMLRSPTAAALRRLSDGTLVDGSWPALVDRSVWERTQHVLDARRRTGRRESTRYLLTGGLAVCGRCGSPMTGHRRGARRYECRTADDGRSFQGCGVSIVADPVEERVRDVLFAALDTATLSRLLEERRRDPNADVLEKIADLEAELDALADDYAESLLTRQAYVKAAERIEARTRGLKGELSQSSAPDVLDGVAADPDALRRKWEGASVPWRRQFAETLVERVEVAPAKWRGGRFDPERLTFVWRA